MMMYSSVGYVFSSSFDCCIFEISFMILIGDMELDHYRWFSSAGVSEADLCFNSCVWRSIIFSLAVEACFQSYWFTGISYIQYTIVTTCKNCLKCRSLPVFPSGLMELKWINFTCILFRYFSFAMWFIFFHIFLIVFHLICDSYSFIFSYKVEIAIRDCAQRLYASKLKLVGRGMLDVHQGFWQFRDKYCIL